MSELQECWPTSSTLLFRVQRKLLDARPDSRSMAKCLDTVQLNLL